MQVRFEIVLPKLSTEDKYDSKSTWSSPIFQPFDENKDARKHIEIIFPYYHDGLKFIFS